MLSEIIEKNELLLPIILVVCSVLVLLSIILVTISLGKISKLKKKYKTLLEGEEESTSKILSEYIDRTKKAEEGIANIRIIQSELERHLNKSICKVGTVKYNAFNNVSSDLSFSTALLDNTDSGFVITGLYSSDGCYVYCKEVINKETKNKLSEEETQALRKALEVGYK